MRFRDGTGGEGGVGGGGTDGTGGLGRGGRGKGGGGRDTGSQCSEAECTGKNSSIPQLSQDVMGKPPLSASATTMSMYEKLSN